VDERQKIVNMSYRFVKCLRLSNEQHEDQKFHKETNILKDEFLIKRRFE